MPLPLTWYHFQPCERQSPFYFFNTSVPKQLLIFIYFYCLKDYGGSNLLSDMVDLRLDLHQDEVSEMEVRHGADRTNLCSDDRANSPVHL